MRTIRLRGAVALVGVLALVGVACGEESSPGTGGSSPAPTGVCASYDTSVGDALAAVCESGTLRVATDQKYKPQSWFDVKDNEWKGFDVDVANEIATRLGVTADIEHQDWAVVTAGSWNDRWDINVGSMTDTVEREALFHFTSAYYYTPAGVTVSGDNTTYTQLSDLDGKKICVGEETTYEDYLNGSLVLGASAPPFEFQIHDAQIISYKTDTDALDELNLGDGVRCDAASSAVPTIQSYIDDGGNMKLLGDPIFYEPLSIALDINDPVDNASLLESISNIVDEMHADGTLSDLSMKWYDEDLTVSTM